MLDTQLYCCPSRCCTCKLVEISAEQAGITDIVIAKTKDSGARQYRFVHEVEHVRDEQERNDHPINLLEHLSCCVRRGPNAHLGGLHVAALEMKVKIACSSATILNRPSGLHSAYILCDFANGTSLPLAYLAGLARRFAMLFTAKSMLIFLAADQIVPFRILCTYRKIP